MLAKDPENLDAMNGLGFLMLNMGKTAEAKTFFEKYLKKDPDAAGPMNGLARCLKDEGKVDEAIAVWEKMCKQNPAKMQARLVWRELMSSVRNTLKRFLYTRSWLRPIRATRSSRKV